MLEYLNAYNMNDCHLLCSSIEAYGQGFLADFGVNVHKFMSLPGVAEYVAYTNFDEDSAPIYSFGQQFKKFNEEIRA